MKMATGKTATMQTEMVYMIMVKMQAIVLVQTDAFGEIALRSHKRFDEVFASDDAMTDIEKDYQ